MFAYKELFLESLALSVSSFFYVYFLFQLASGIYSFTYSLWNHHTDTFLQQICGRDETAISNALERTLLSLKGNKIAISQFNSLQWYF